MYAPAAYRETREDVLCDAISAIRLCTLVTPSDAGIQITHAPVSLTRAGDRVTIETHLARANPHWTALEGGAPSVAVFQGPHAYVSPSWYPSKAATGKVVPTWAYIAVHAHGAASLIEDAAALRARLEAMTSATEAGRPEPWAVSDAPEPYLDAMMRGIVGVRLTVDRLEGAWKINQNKTEADREGTRQGLLAAGPDGASLAAAMAGRTG